MGDFIIKTNVPKSAEDIVIFVHGFGVRYDSRGMFTDIKLGLDDKLGTVMFDFYKIKDQNVYIQSIEDQVKTLKGVYQKIKSNHPNKKISIIAHSMGCIVVSIAKLKVDGSVIFLAPPDNFGGKRLELYFRNYNGAHEQNDELIVPRKDSTISHIPLLFFKELANIDPLKSMLEYSKFMKLHILQTTNDEVIGQTNYSVLLATADIIKIHADHNFSDNSRSILIKTINKILLVK